MPINQHLQHLHSQSMGRLSAAQAESITTDTADLQSNNVATYRGFGVSLEHPQKKSLKARAASFFRRASNTLNPFKRNTTSLGDGPRQRVRNIAFLAPRAQTGLHGAQPATSGFSTVMGSPLPTLQASQSGLTKCVSAWHAGRIDSHSQKIWRRAEKSNPAGAQTLAVFLIRLERTSAARNPAFKQQVNTLLLQLSKSPELLEQSFAIATGATETCDDRVTRTFNQLQLASVIHDMSTGKYDTQVGSAFAIAQDVFKLECIEAIAHKTVADRLRQTLQSPDLQDVLNVTASYFESMSDEQKVDRALKLIEPIEVHMYYQVHLKSLCDIQLPVPAMIFGDTAELKMRDIAIAAATVHKSVTEEFPTWLTKWGPWETFMQRVDPECHAAMLAARNGKLEEVTYDRDNMIDAEIRRTTPDTDLGTIDYFLNDPDTRDSNGRIVTDRAVAEVQIGFTNTFINRNQPIDPDQ
jgi:hypothetical protein